MLIKTSSSVFFIRVLNKNKIPSDETIQHGTKNNFSSNRILIFIKAKIQKTLVEDINQIRPRNEDK